MKNLSTIIDDARRGEIFHFQGAHELRPVADLLSDAIRQNLGPTATRSNLLTDLSWERFDEALTATSGVLDKSEAHSTLLGQLLLASGVRGENLLHITLSKSCRASLAEQGKRNAGYPPHRDSWFGLAPDGVNIVVYLTSVPYYGNTAFYPDYFGKDVPYDPDSRTPLPPCDLARVTSFNCAVGDCLVFCGDHLHGGASVEVDRFSVEFRLSKSVSYGRPEQGIVYKPIV